MVEHHVAEKVAENATLAGGLSAVIGGLTSTDIAAFGGLIVGLIGLAVNIYFKVESNKRAKELHAKRLAKLEEDEL